MERKAFLDQEPPPGYVAGVGRGATGFTTSADTGPVRFESNLGTEDEDQGVLALKRRNDDDIEADEIYEAIEKQLEKRRKRKSAEPEDGVVTIETGSGTITSGFLVLKNQLASVLAQEWANLPEVGDLTRRNKRQRLLEQQLQRTYAAPDMLISGSGGGFKEDKTTTNENTESLLEELEAEASQRMDIDRSRQILASLRKTEPNKADLWIASARLEEQAKNFDAAKKLIVEGCTKVPYSELVWLESVKIHRKSSESTKLCKFIINEALRLNSESEKLWLQAVELENPADVHSRRKILMKALEFIPLNAKLWKALVDLDSDNEDAKRILEKATQLCPDSWELWLELLKLSDYTESKKALNSARKQLPKNPHIWVTALKLEEREKADIGVHKLTKMLKKGFEELLKNSYSHGNDFWLEEAATAEQERFPTTGKAIVENVYSLLPEGDSRVGEVFKAAEKLTKLSATGCSIHLYDTLTQAYPNNISCWSRLFKVLREEKLDAKEIYRFYENAIEANPNVEVLRLMYAKDAWVVCSDVAHARDVLNKAEEMFPKSEKIHLAKLKLSIVSKDYKSAFVVAKAAVDEAPTTLPKLWYKYIHLVRFCLYKQLDFAKAVSLVELCDEALANFPEEPKLYLQKAQVLEDDGELRQAREALSIGSRICPKSAEVWISLANVDVKLGNPSRARSILDTAILENPKSASLWVAKIQLELDGNDIPTVRQLINRGRQQFPSSPEVWIHHLTMIPKMSHRKNAFIDALKQTNNASQILLGIGVFFWIDGQFGKAKAWFDRALNADKLNGDAWGWAFCFIEKQGSESDKALLVENLKKHFDLINKGKTWISVVKDHRNFDKGPSEIIAEVSQKLLKTSVAK